MPTLRQAYHDLPPGLSHRPIHGDPWAGNVAATATGPVLLDLEGFALGSPEWDLASVAVSCATFTTVSPSEWAEFCMACGWDVTAWNGFEILRNIRELRKVTFAIQIAENHSYARPQAARRIACLRGRCGLHPWHWQPGP